MNKKNKNNNTINRLRLKGDSIKNKCVKNNKVKIVHSIYYLDGRDKNTKLAYNNIFIVVPRKKQS